jgi:hypothetical protein
LGAERRFFTLSEALALSGASAAIIGLTQEARADEARHVKLCSEAARDLGHPTGFALPDDHMVAVPREWIGRETPIDSLLCEVVMMCCITETINASLLNTIYASARETPSRTLVHEILKDEVKHSQIGWAHLAAEEKRRDLRVLGRYLPGMFEICVRDELFQPAPADAGDQESFDFGVMPVAHRLEQFRATTEQVVIPGFEKYGIDTAGVRAWLDRKSLRQRRYARAFSSFLPDAGRTEILLGCTSGFLGSARVSTPCLSSA